MNNSFPSKNHKILITTLILTLTLRDPDYHRSVTVSSATRVRHLYFELCENRSSSFLCNPANKQTNIDENITSLADVIIYIRLNSCIPARSAGTHTPFKRPFFPGERELAGCPLNSPSPFNAHPFGTGLSFPCS